MTRTPVSSHLRTLGLTWRIMAAAGLGGLLFITPVKADPASARRVVKAMSDYMASQKNLSGEFDVELDIITPALEKVQFDASGTVRIARPNKLHITRTGGYAEMELISDGKIVTIWDRGGNVYAQQKAPATVDGVIDQLRFDYGVEMPGADLLLTSSYNELMAGVLEAKHIGVGVIDGKECEHLAFRNADTDWQLWVRTGNQPVPCKYVISSKTVAGAPEYAIRFHSWKAGQAAPATAFNFRPRGAKAVSFDQLSGIGELPPAAPFSAGVQ